MKKRININNIVSKVLSEEINKKSIDMTKIINEGKWMEVEVNEKLHGNQHKLDVAKPKGKLTKADFDKLREEDESDDDDYTDFVVNMIDSEIKETGEYEGGDFNEQETEEGNAFTGALKRAKEKGDSHFEVDGKKYPVKESIKLTESELIDIIEKIVLEQKSKTPAGLKQTEKVLNLNKKENDDYTKEVTEKMNKYVKMGSKGKYEPKPKSFPSSNYDMENDEVVKYEPSEAVEEYIEAFSYPGQTNIRYDEIKPNNDRIKKHLKGDSTTGNATKDKDGNPLGNVVDSEVGERFMKNYEDNLYGIEQSDASYKRYEQPVVDIEGKEKSKGKLKKKSNKILNQLESMDIKTDKIIIEDLKKMKNLISYNLKTQ